MLKQTMFPRSLSAFSAKSGKFIPSTLRAWGCSLLLAGLLGSSAQALDARLSLNSSLTLGCEVVGIRAGLQQDRFGGHIQGGYCASNVEGQSGGPVFGGALTFDVYQSSTLNAYLMGGLRSNLAGNPSITGGLGLRYGVPLVPFEGYVEAQGIYTNNPILGATPGVQLAIGATYLVRALDLTALQGESRPSNISRPGTSGLNVNQSADSNPLASSEAAPASCKIDPAMDASNAESAARSAASQALSAAASGASALYSNIKYDISVGGANIEGNRARVSGSITVSAVRRSDGQEVGDTYSGVVILSRSGCGWTAVSYQRDGE